MGFSVCARYPRVVLSLVQGLTVLLVLVLLLSSYCLKWCCGLKKLGAGTESCSFPTGDIMGAQGFKFIQNGGFPASVFVCIFWKTVFQQPKIKRGEFNFCLSPLFDTTDFWYRYFAA